MRQMRLTRDRPMGGSTPPLVHTPLENKEDNMSNWNVRITIAAEENSAMHAELSAALSGLDNPLTALLNREATVVESEAAEDAEVVEMVARLESEVVPDDFSHTYSEGAIRIKFECAIPNLAPLHAFVSDLGDTWVTEITIEAVSPESGQALRVFMRKGLYHGLYAGDIFKYHVQPELRSFITEMTSFTKFYEYPKTNLVVEEKSEVETLDMPKSTATITHASNETAEA